MKATILDPVYSRITPKEEIDKILPCLRYEKEGLGGIIEEKYLIRQTRVLTGLIPRISEYCKRKEIFLEISECGDLHLSVEKEEPELPGMIFREDQKGIIKSVAANQRGWIKSATGSGKTVLAGGIFSLWPSSHSIFLCHTIDLLQQAHKAFTQKFGFKNVFTLGDGKNKFHWPTEPTILISTIQTLINFDLLSHCDWPDAVIIDECHHLQSDKGMMAEILEKLMAPARIGLSAQEPKSSKGKMVLEGYLGPLIGEFTYEEGVKAGILAKPFFNLIPVLYSPEIGETSNYRDHKDPEGNTIKGIYRKGIIENKARNRLILIAAEESIKKGESVLIITSRDTTHGHILSEMARDIFDLEIPFLYGETSKKDRQRAKDMLENKELLAAITNIIWKEGINIPSLNHIINAGGEKDSIQIVGRGSRTTEDKKYVYITDFLDPYKYLSHHTVLRLIEYAKNGWLNFQNIL